jgi:opacity protein-like surface antigen
MKKVLALVVIVLTLAAPVIMQAQEGYYAGAQGGVNFLDSHFLKARHCKFDTGYNVGIVGGYASCVGWRLESEITYHDNRYSLHGTNEQAQKTRYHGNVYTWSAMLNGYYDISLLKCWNIAPYIGAGIGADNVHQSIRILGEKFKGSNTGFAWQVMTGINYFLLEDVVLSAEYKYHSAPLRHGHHLQNQSVTFGVKKFFCF